MLRARGHSDEKSYELCTRGVPKVVVDLRPLGDANGPSVVRTLLHRGFPNRKDEQGGWSVCHTLL